MMAAPVTRRGACPALSSPMQTGDGLLVRLNPVAQGLTPEQLAGLCESAARNGNGTVEVTARGSFQVRGLTPDTTSRLADDVNRLGIEVRTGVPIDMQPLAGLDPAEIADPRPLAAMIRDGIASGGLEARLGPKVSVVIDGGGSISMNAMMADVRLTAANRRGRPLWRLALAGDARNATAMGAASTEGAAGFALDLLVQIAKRGRDARARDLLETDKRSPPAAVSPTSRPILPLIALVDGRIALAVALPFGNAQANMVAAFARTARDFDVSELRLAPGRALFALCPDVKAAKDLKRSAEVLGFVTDSADPRLMISACAGAPACASAFIDTRSLAGRIATERAKLVSTVGDIHVSGCAKGCAHPAAAPLTLVGGKDGVGLVANGTARDQPRAYVRLDDLPACLPEITVTATGRP